MFLPSWRALRAFVPSRICPHFFSLREDNHGVRAGKEIPLTPFPQSASQPISPLLPAFQLPQKSQRHRMIFRTKGPSSKRHEFFPKRDARPDATEFGRAVEATAVRERYFSCALIT